jgi:hypothetical protein
MSVTLNNQICIRVLLHYTRRAGDKDDQRQLPYYRMCSLTTECVLLEVMKMTKGNYLTTECVLLLQNVFFYR